MAQITLEFTPDFSKVKSGIAELKTELGNLTISHSGAKATQSIAADLQKVTGAAHSASGAMSEVIKKTQTRVDGFLAQTTSEVRKAAGEYEKTIVNRAKKEEQVVESTTKVYIDNAEERRKASEKAAKEEQKEQDALNKAYVQGYTQREKEIEKKQRETWSAFLKGEKEYKAKVKQLEDEKVKQAEAANRQLVADEEEAMRQRSVAWKAYIDEINKKTAASETAASLEKTYSNLLRQIDALKSKYPAGTFDEIEQQVREARTELQGLDKNTETYVQDVERLRGQLPGLQRDFANVRAETTKLQDVQDKLWTSFKNNVNRYLIGNLSTRIVSSIRSAINELKDVDSELVNIRKVSGMTADEVAAIGERAYETATKYGVAASEYLEAVYTFQKAGLGESAEDMGELAVKTMLVGDTTAEVASRFLISSNAAWKYKGNIQELSRIVDEADYINNNYAATLEDIAIALPIVGATASQVGMTTEQTMSAIATIVASTGQSANKAATALRAIIMNLVGQTGELDDGLVVTEETIASLNTVLNVYAKDALAAAEASGTIVDPMEAIAALAQAAEDGFLNEAQLFETLAGLGGKLRTTQLTALVNNMEMYNSMLEGTADAAGTADKEVGLMMESWEKKLQNLKTEWTQFVSHLIDTGTIKKALDAIIKLVDWLDTDLGKATVTVGAATYAFLGLASGVSKAVHNVKELVKAAPKLIEVLSPIWSKFLALGGGTVATAAGAVGILGVTAAGSVAMYNYLTTTEEEYKQAAEEATSAYEAAKTEFDELVSKSGKLTKEEESRLDVLRQQLSVLRQQQGTAVYQQYMDQYDPTDPNKNAASVATQYQRDYYYQTQNGWTENAAETERKIREMAAALQAYSDVLGKDLPQSGVYALSILNGMITAWDETAEATEETTRATEETIDDQNVLTETSKKLYDAQTALRTILQHVSDTATKYDEAIGGVVDAVSNFGDGSIELYDAMTKLERAIPGSTDKIYDFDTATITTKDDIFSSKDALLDFIDTTKQLEFSQAISELEKLSASYWDVAGAALAAMNAQAANQMAGVLSFTTGVTAQPDDISRQLTDLKSQKADWDAYVATLRARSGYSGSSGSSGGSTRTATDTSTGSTADYELERLKAIVSYEKAELSFLQASGKSLDEINAKRKVIQAALHDEAEYLRAQLATLKAQEVAEEDKAEHEAKIKDLESDILALSTEWWNIQKNINDDLAKAEEERLKAEEERLKKLEEERKLLEEQKKLQQQMFDELKSAVDDYYAKLISEKEEELSLEEKILAVQQAQAALANAQRERNVRYYNASTGQWEWQANAKNVQSAKDALKKAQDDLNKYQRDQAWKAFKSAWEYVAEQIKSGAMTFKEAYDYMYKAMKGIQDKYGVDLGATLEDSIGGFKNLNYGIDGLTREVADSLGASVGVLDEKLKEYETAVGAFKKAFDEASEKVKSGEWSMEDAFSYLRDKAREIADKYGIDMTGALEQAISEMDKTNMSIDELWKSVIITLMKVNSARWFDATDEEKAMLHAQNEYLGKLIGATYDPSGYWYLNGSKLYESQKGANYSSGGYGSSTGSGGGYGSSGGSSSGSGGYGTMHMTTTGYTKEYTDEVIGKLKEIPEGVYDPRLVPNMGTNAHKVEWALEHNAGSYKGAIYAGPLMKNAYTDPKRWTDPEAWAAYSNLKEADDEYAAKLHAIEDAIANGASEEDVIGMINDLYAEGDFAAIPGEDGGLPTGWVKAGYGNANGEYLLILGGKIWHTGVDTGSMAQDLWGNRWEIGEDGTLTPIARAWENGGDSLAEYDDGMMDLGNSDIGISEGGGSLSDSNALGTEGGASTNVTNNNQTITINGVHISESDAKRMTIFELASLASSLGSYSAR